MYVYQYINCKDVVNNLYYLKLFRSVIQNMDMELYSDKTITIFATKLFTTLNF